MRKNFTSLKANVWLRQTQKSDTTKMELNKIYNEDCIVGLSKIPDNSVDLIVTSPPYNKCARQQNNFKSVSWSAGRIKYDLYDDNKPQEEYEEWQKQILRECVRVLKPTGSIFYNHKQQIRNHKCIFPHRWLEEFNVRQMIVWNRKNSPVLEPIRFLPCTEYLFWITKERTTPKFNGNCFAYSEVWEIVPEIGNDHPSPFPKELVRRCIIATTEENDLVLDPFAGSGTAMLVAKQLNRKYIGFEISQQYIDIANERLNQTNVSDFWSNDTHNRNFIQQ